MRKIIKINLINFFFLLYSELLFTLFMFTNVSKDTIISNLIFLIFFSFIITIVTTSFNEKVNRIVHYVIYILISLWFSTQFVFKSMFKTFFSFSMFGLSDQATDYMGVTLKIIFNNLYGIIIFFLPIILLVIFRKKINFNILKEEKRYLFIYLIIIPLSFCSYRLYLNTKKNEVMSIYDLYYNVNNNNLAIQKLGVVPSATLDIYRTIFGFEEKINNIEYWEEDNEREEEKEKIYEDNKLDLTLDDDIPFAIKNYIEGSTPSKKNEYSGIFKNKNLIFVVAESYSEIGVSEELTPTLYKLSHNGFVFNNFYVPYYLSTIGGEFQALTGLFPDTSILSTWRSGNTYFPYGIGNIFKENGYNAYAYHNNSGYFQDRNKYLKSLGFDNFKACYMGLDIDCDVWPESDIEMIEKSYNDYINSDKPFITYYMTVSGHFEYTFDDNYIAFKNKEYVKDLPYGEKVKGYIACMIELDKAMETLINELKKNNKLDDTVIVLLADHYPYDLDINEINEISSYKRDELFEVNHNSLIIWNNELETREIDKYGMSIDVIPTIYNLFGIEYDSRLFAGTDLLSDSDGLVMLGNRSWITNKGKYNSTNNTFSGIYDKDYIDYVNSIVQNKIAYSKDIFTYNGYKYIKESN